jgi:hypothetical protein
VFVPGVAGKTLVSQETQQINNGYESRSGSQKEDHAHLLLECLGVEGGLSSGGVGSKSLIVVTRSLAPDIADSFVGY